MADNTYYGAGTYNEGVYQPYQVAPEPITDPETLGAPATTLAGATYPDSLSDAETITGPDAATASSTAPDGITDTDATGAPTPGVAIIASPASITDTETTDGATVQLPGNTSPDSTVDTETLDGPTTTTAALSATGSVTDTETLTAPDLTAAVDVTPASLTDPETTGEPAVSTTATITPDSITDPETPQGASVGGANITYGTGTYGEGVYFGADLPANQSSTPPELWETETLGAPTTSFAPQQNPNYEYGAGDYGKGLYFGQPAPDRPGADPLFPPNPYTYRQPAQHIMGVGPSQTAVTWAKIPNYGAMTRLRGPRPVVGLPTADSKSFTLRLNEGGEGRAEFTFTRERTIIPEKLATDLWWRRREPTTGELEVVGRFNTASTDVSMSEDGVNVSVTWVDYRTLLAERMVLRYLDTANSETQWDKNTPLVEIMRFAVPTNMGLDLSVLDATDPAGLGNTISPFELPLGSTIAETFENLLAISPDPWEWWVEMPAALDAAPKLRIVVGTRGRDQGVVLADTGGPTPIAAWTQTSSADQYANSLYFIGADGGDVVQLDDDIARYGQRDASDSDSSVKGTKDSTGKPYLLDRAAKKRLAALADLRPTYTVTLAPGWWRGRSHIDIGDSVSIVIRLGAQLLTGKYRVTELSCTVDSTGGEQVQLTLGKPLTSANPRSRRSALARIVARLKNYERRAT